MLKELLELFLCGCIELFGMIIFIYLPIKFCLDNGYIVGLGVYLIIFSLVFGTIVTYISSNEDDE